MEIQTAGVIGAGQMDAGIAQVVATNGIQDHNADEFAHCYGCGKLNDDGCI